MIEVGAGREAGDGSDLAVFVARMAAAGSDPATAAARDRVRHRLDAGEVPPGVQRLAEALAASIGDIPPAQRFPAEDADSIVAAVRAASFVVLADADREGVAEAVTALLADGRRVVVTAADQAPLQELRATLGSAPAGLLLDEVPALTAAEMRELRRLLATSTARHRDRAGQHMPDPDPFAAPEEVARWCARAVRTGAATAQLGLVPTLLAELDANRREAVTSVARGVQQSLAGMPSPAEAPWAWTLLGELIYGRHRPEFDRLHQDTVHAAAALDRALALPPVAITGVLPPGALDALRRYADFLAAGGRARLLRQPAARREAAPVLEQVQVGGRAPETEVEVRRAIAHLELGERLAGIDRTCHEVGIPAPRDEAELHRITDGLVQIAAAARSVGALRHDVLFLAEGSPLAVPDVDAAEQVAAEIIDYAEHGSAAEAADRLDALATELAGLVPAVAVAPEHEAAVRALRERDATGYAAAVAELDTARHEAADERRRVGLLQQLARSAPRLAAAWADRSRDRSRAFGFLCLRPVEALLRDLPPADGVDVVLVLGAHRMGVERLLLAAVAPRLVAVVPPGERAEASPTVLGVLQSAGALVLLPPSAGGGRVVRMTPGRPAARPGGATVGQAGA